MINRLADTSAQIRIRLSMLLVVGLGALATHLGFEAILGAFLAGAILHLLRARAWSPSRRTFAGRHPRRSGRMRWVYSSAMRAACQLNAPPRLTLEATCRNHRFPKLR